jgi:hypothetical protein
MSASPKRNGGILLGLEGSEYQKWDQVGHKHALIADSSSHSPTWGFKWRISKKSKTNNEYYQDLSLDQGPSKYNGMFVDLSEGWEFLMELEPLWEDDFVMETSKKEKSEKIKFSNEKWKNIDEKIAFKNRHATVIPTRNNEGKTKGRRMGLVPSGMAPSYEDIEDVEEEELDKKMSFRNQFISLPNMPLEFQKNEIQEEDLLDFNFK